jgi:6-phosphogluconolactonase (cycloisomerase 2 family)
VRRVLSALPLAVVLLGLGLAAAPGAQPAAAAGGFRFVECLTGKRPVTVEPRTPREGGCKVTGTVAGDGEGSGVNHLSGLVASPDGRSLYAVSNRDDAVAAFASRPLALQQCFTTNAKLRDRGKQPCKLLPHPGTEDVVSGFNGVHFVTVSPDGRSVYTVSDDGSIGVFARARSSGKLTYKGCITGDRSKFGSTRNGACKAIPSATNFSGGLFSGLGGPVTLTVSPDSRFVYVTLSEEPGIATLARSPDGSLQFVSCLRGKASRFFVSNGATSPCPLVAPEANNPNGSGLAGPRRIVISADGTSLYVSSPRRGALAEFRRDPATGALTFQGCLSAANRGTGPGDPCRYVPQANDIGVNTGLDGMAEIALSPDGTGLYGVSTYDNSVSAFSRDPVTGTLSFASCLSGDSELGKDFAVPDPCGDVPAAVPHSSGSGLTKPRGIAISGDGRSLFVAAPGDAAIDRFRLSAGGGLRFASCLTGALKAAGPCTRVHAKGGKLQRLGFEGFSSLAVAGHDLYASASGGSAVSRFSFP